MITKEQREKDRAICEAAGLGRTVRERFLAYIADAEEMERRVEEIGALWEHHRAASGKAHADGDTTMALHEMAMCSAYERASKILRGEP